MKKDNFNIITILALISVILVGSSILTIWIVPNYFKEYTRIVNLMVWIVIFILSAPIQNEHSRFKGKSDKIKTCLIIIIIYYMIYFASGIIFGYQKSPYSRNILLLIKNIVFIVGAFCMQEYVRSKFVNNTKNMKIYVLITIVFAFINLDYTNFFSNFESGETIFKFIVGKLIPQIAISCICTYLAKTGGTILIYSYRLPIVFLTVILPIFPNLDWFVSCILDVLVTIILFILINYEHTIKINRLTRGEKKEINPKSSVFMVIFSIMFIVFIAGLMPYKPVAVMSNSMVPYFTRGYVVIVKKIEKEDLKNLKVGDILEYQLDENMILHRIINIEKGKNNELLFTTQGDNNDFPDMKKVEEEQIVGVIKFKIPYIRLSICMV